MGTTKSRRAKGIRVKRTKYHHTYVREKLDKRTIDAAILIKLLAYLMPYRFLLALGVLLLFAAKVIEAFIPIYIGEVTQKILNFYSFPNSNGQELFDTVLLSSFFIILLLIAGYLLEAVNVIIKSWAGQRALIALREQVYRHIICLPLSYYDSHAVGSLMTRTIHDVDQINQMFAESVIPIIGNAMLFIAIFVGIAAINWPLAIVLGMLMPLVFLHTNLFRKTQRKSFDTVRLIVSAMISFLQEYLMGIGIIRKFGLIKKEMNYFNEINEDHKNAYLETIYNFSFFTSGIDFAISLFFVVVFVMLVLFAPPEGFQAGTYFTLSLYVLMIFRPLTDLAERYNVLQAAFAAAERIFHLLDVKVENLDEGLDSLQEIETIEFEDVWFAYKDDDWVLKGLSFKVYKGESIAFVGITGAGKTTIISLLLRLYEIQKGLIKINGISIDKYSKKWLRKHFSVVLQDPVIFSGTILDNIRLFDEHIPVHEVERAIDYVNLRGYLERFPNGIHHLLAERGKSLSAGEMQLISLARAVVRKSSILILDEATANIDIQTERAIQDALGKIFKEKTALVIAHRLSTIQRAKRILVIHHGKLAESGTHQQLLASKGIYEKLYQLIQ